MVVKFPGRWKVKSSAFTPASPEQAVAVSSAMAVMRGRMVQAIHFVETSNGGARLVIELGGKR